MLIDGSCHCGNITFALDWQGDPDDIPARACSCSFCLKHVGVWTANANSRLAVTVRDPAALSKYTFGTKTAVFHICTTCGVVPLVISEIDSQLHAVVNINAFHNVDSKRFSRSPANFGNEDVDTRLARRKRSWIANVDLTASAKPTPTGP